MAEIRSNAASVEFRNVTKIYGKDEAPAVNNLSMEIEDEEFLVVVRCPVRPDLR